MIGAAGSVGRYALRYLASGGDAAVSAFGRSPEKVASDPFFSGMTGVSWQYGDAADPAAVRAFLRGKDVILNTLFCNDAVRAEIAAQCGQAGAAYLDTGMFAQGAAHPAGGTLCLTGAGALPGLSSVLTAGAASGFRRVSSYTHIASLSGTFSYGAAYDYLSGVSRTAAAGTARPDKRSGVQLPFVGTADLRQYQDAETDFLSRQLSCSGRHYIAFGSQKIQQALERAALLFPSSPEEAVEQVLAQSRLYHIRARDHMAFFIEMHGELPDGTEGVRTLVLKFASSPSLTGITSGICAALAARGDCGGDFLLSELPAQPFAAAWSGAIADALRTAPDCILFETYDVCMDALNEEMSGEI